MKKRADGRYQKAVTLPDGKRKVFYGKTQAELNRKILAYQYGVDQGPTFTKMAEQWSEWDETIHAHNTVEAHKTPLKRAVAFFEGERVKDITPVQVGAYIRTVEARGIARHSIQMHLTVVKSVFDFAIMQGIVQINPCAAVRIENGAPPGTRSLASESDIKAIKAHHLDDRFSFLPFLLMYTGLRVGEALALTRADFDLKANTISITKKITWHGNDPVVDDFTKTPKGLRTVPLLNVLRDALPEWDGILFGREGYYTKSQFRWEWDLYKKRTGVQCDRHTLRHEFATLMYDAGVDIKEAARITGHDEQVLLHTYQHIRESRKNAAADKLNAYLNQV